MAKKVCKSCRIVVKEDVCPICKRNQFSSNFNGRILVLNAEKSHIGKKIAAPIAGEYAIKVR